MPIKSYIAFPDPKKHQAFKQEISQIPECELLDSDDGETFVLVTDTANDLEEKNLTSRLESITSLLGLSLVGAWSDQAINKA